VHGVSCRRCACAFYYAFCCRFLRDALLLMLSLCHAMLCYTFRCFLPFAIRHATPFTPTSTFACAARRHTRCLKRHGARELRRRWQIRAVGCLPFVTIIRHDDYAALFRYYAAKRARCVGFCALRSRGATLMRVRHAAKYVHRNGCIGGSLARTPACFTISPPPRRYAVALITPFIIFATLSSACAGGAQHVDFSR